MCQSLFVLSATIVHYKSPAGPSTAIWATTLPAPTLLGTELFASFLLFRFKTLTEVFVFGFVFLYCFFLIQAILFLSLKKVFLAVFSFYAVIFQSVLYTDFIIIILLLIILCFQRPLCSKRFCTRVGF